MYRLICICSALTLLFISSIAFSQEKTPKTLLWRISGKGLAQPSYLYGTMHLTDKRIFNFGDSVYRAIEKCEGLAIELNPDEMGAYLVNQALDETTSKKLSEILNQKDFNKYREALAKKFKKSADHVTTTDIVKEKNKWISELLEKGEMATFVDAWLYNAARRQGKWVGGVEDMSDQAGLMDDLVDRSDIEYLLASDSLVRKSSDKEIERMIELYVNQDLDGIDGFYNKEYSEEKDVLLIKRNAKMARRIDSLMTFRTMFVAVGAAHLPGDSGVIKLLRARGFTVEPVYSTQKINAMQYKIKEVQIPWQQIEDEQRLYKASMPGNPATVKLYEMIEMKFLLDIYSLSNYCTMAIVNPDNKSNKDSLINNLAGRMLHPSVVKTGKKIVNNGIEGKEFVQADKGENIRMQAFIHGKVVYVAFIYAVKKEVIGSADADKFFASFAINPSPVAAASKTWRFTDSIMGVTFNSPALLAYNSKLSSTATPGWKISCFNGADPVNGSYTMLFSKEITAGHHLISDSMVHSDLLNNLGSKCSSIHHSAKTIQGYNGMEIVGRNADQPGLYVRAISLIRDNRNLVFLTMSDSARLFAPEVEGMYSSLRFISPAVQFTNHITPDGACQAPTPAPFRLYEGSSLSVFVSYDTTTATTYMVMSDTINKYMWYASDSSFWKETIAGITGEDSLVSVVDIQNGPLKGKEILLTGTWGNVYRRVRLLLNDTILYKVLISGKRDLINNRHANQFIEGFTVLHPSAGNNFITTSKALKLLTDLRSADSATRKRAFDALEEAPFTKKDLGLLHGALFKRYDSSSINHSQGDLNDKIARVLARLADSSTVDFVQSTYPSLINDKRPLGNTALLLLSKLKTKQSYAALARLVQHPNYTPLTDDVIYSLDDSLALTVTLYPALQKLFKDSVHAAELARIPMKLMDSGFITKEQAAQCESDFIKAAMYRLPEQIKDDENDFDVYHLLNLLGRFKSTASNNVLKKYLAAKSIFLKKEAIRWLLHNKQAVPAVALNAVAADGYYRATFYEMLQELKRTDLFPKQYLTQAHFAASAVTFAATDDYDPEKVVFLSTKIATHKGKKYLFYLYKVVYEGDESYLGIAGGYIPGSTSLQPKADLTGLYWSAAYDPKRVNEFFKEFLKND